MTFPHVKKMLVYLLVVTFGKNRRHNVMVVEVRISEVTLKNEMVTRSDIRLANETAKMLVSTTM